MIRKFLAILLLPMLLTSCTVSFTYNHLDWIIPWYVDDYVDLTRDQKKSLRQQLEPILAWHREEELVRYVEILDGIEASLAQPLTAEEVNRWIQLIVDAAERTELRMLQLGLGFSDELTDAQMQEFIDALWERQRDFEEEFLERTDEEYVEDNGEEMAQFMKKLIGRLSPEQKARFQVAAGELCRFDQPWLTDSENWLNELEPLLQRSGDWKTAVEDAFKKRKSERTPEFRACLDLNYAVISQAAADVLNGASERQRDHLYREIEKLRSRLLKLIEAGVEPPVDR